MSKMAGSWIGADGLLELERFVSAQVPPEHQSTTWALLCPLLKEVPTDEAAWLCRARDWLRVALVGSTAEVLVDRLAAISRWRRLCNAVVADWTERPDRLDNNAILGRLRQLAVRAAAGLPRYIRQRATDEAPGVIVRAFARFDRNRPFSRWARRVLRNRAISIYRSESRTRPDQAHLATLASPDPSTADDLAEVLRDLRGLCDRIRFPKPTARGAQLAAVFAIELRLRLLDELALYGPEFLDAHLPLRAGERSLRIRRGWPTVGELWDESKASTEPPQRNLDLVRCACQRLAPEVTDRRSNWHTWVDRAKKQVCRHLDSDAQERLFVYLFPGHARCEANCSGNQAGQVSWTGSPPRPRDECLEPQPRRSHV